MAETQNTGQFAKVIVTDVGKDMIAKSQNGQVLTFSRVALGDGLVAEDEDVTKFTAVKNERLSVPIAKYSNLGNGQFEVQFRLTNTQVESGFWHREIGIIAKIDNGEEQLYAYTTAGNKASYIYDKTTPIEERIVNVTFVVGNAQNIEVIINSSVIYSTLEDLEEAVAEVKKYTDAAITTHDENSAAHEELLDEVDPIVKISENAGTITAETYKGTKHNFHAGLNILARNKAYAYGDIAYSPNLPSWAYLYCVQAGTTAASEPSFASVNTMGQYITDGTCEWIVDDIRFNTPVGVVFYDTYLHDGCVKINGATVQRSDYKRPFKIATDKNLFYDKDDTYTFTGTTTVSGTTITGISAEDIEKLQTAKEVCGDGILITGTGIPEDCMIDEISTDSVTITVAATAAGTVKISYGNIHNYPYLYGWGDGETTFVLPNYRGRVIQGGDILKVNAPALPNIIGYVKGGMAENCSPSATGAFSNLWGGCDRIGGDDWAAKNIDFNASRCSKVYRDNFNTVQPPAIVSLPQIRF